MFWKFFPVRNLIMRLLRFQEFLKFSPRWDRQWLYIYQIIGSTGEVCILLGIILVRSWVWIPTGVGLIFSFYLSRVSSNKSQEVVLNNTSSAINDDQLCCLWAKTSLINQDWKECLKRSSPLDCISGFCHGKNVCSETWISAKCRRNFQNETRLSFFFPIKMTSMPFVAFPPPLKKIKIARKTFFLLRKLFSLAAKKNWDILIKKELQTVSIYSFVTLQCGSLRGLGCPKLLPGLSIILKRYPEKREDTVKNTKVYSQFLIREETKIKGP